MKPSPPIANNKPTEGKNALTDRRSAWASTHGTVAAIEDPRSSPDQHRELSNIVRVSEDQEISSPSSPVRKQIFPPGARFRLARFLETIRRIEKDCEFYRHYQNAQIVENVHLKLLLGSIDDLVLEARTHADVFADLMKGPRKRVAVVDSHEEADRILAETLRLRLGSR